MTRPVTLVVSIDTEEDDWERRRDGVTVDNARALPGLHQLLRGLGVRPTWFVSWAMLRDARSAGILRELAADPACEMAAHLHPWNTPPLDESFVARNSVMKNLAPALQEAKLRTLTEAHAETFGAVPSAFRAGRFGLGAASLSAAARCGYTVDSSVTPFISWKAYDDGADHDGAPLMPYRVAPGGDPRVPVPDGTLVELPVTAGYTRAPFARAHGIWRRLQAPALARLRLPTVAARGGLLRPVTLSPETDSLRDMLTLARHVVDSGVRYLHVFWHSPTLLPGLGPFTRTTADVARFEDRIRGFVEALGARHPLRMATAAEAAALLGGSGAPSGATAAGGVA